MNEDHLKDIVKPILYKRLREKSLKLLKDSGVRGGVMIVHPYRCNFFGRYEKPGLHFHIVGYGNVVGEDVADVYAREGYIIRNFGSRKSIFKTLYYILSHCGIARKKERVDNEGVVYYTRPVYDTITYFGCLSYNKLKYKDKNELPGCPMCPKVANGLIYVNYFEVLSEDNKIKYPNEFLETPNNWIDITQIN